MQDLRSIKLTPSICSHPDDYWRGYILLHMLIALNIVSARSAALATWELYIGALTAE